MSGPRVGGAAVQDTRERIGIRDLGVVRQVAGLRLMSGRQIEAVHFPSADHVLTETAARQCRRVLARLVRDRILQRLDRRVGGIRAGSSSYVYALGPVGHRLLDGDRARPRRYEPSVTFIAHQLAVSQLVVDLTLASRSGVFELLDVEGEPACWRTVPTMGRVVLRPDLFLAVGANELEYLWFVEVDRGTHHRPAVLRKARLYENYYRSGVEQATHGVFPRVVWIAPDETRATRLRNALDSGELTDGLMLITTADEALRVLAGAEV